MSRVPSSSQRNRKYWRAVAKSRNRWIAGLPEMEGVEQLLAKGGSTLLSGEPASDGSTGEAELLGDVSGRRLLHLGSGSGHDSVSWANLGAHVTAVDWVGDNLRECRRLSRRANHEVDLVSADALQLPFQPESFDAVYAAGLVAWIGDLARLYEEVARVLVPGGRLLAVEEHPKAMTLNEEGVSEPARYLYRDQVLQNQVDTSNLPWPMPAGELETDDYLWTSGTLVTRMLKAGLHLEKLLEPYWRANSAEAMDSKPAPIPSCLVIMAQRRK